MRSRLSFLGGLAVAAACSGSSGGAGTYSAANGDPITVDFKSGGVALRA